MTTFNTNLFHRGKLRYVATFQNPVLVDDGAGGQTVSSFTDVFTTRCQLISNSGSEILGTGQIYYNQDFTMRCGWRPTSYASITVDTIVEIRGPGFSSQTFKIKNFNPVDMKSHIYEFNLSYNKKTN